MKTPKELQQVEQKKKERNKDEYLAEVSILETVLSHAVDIAVEEGSLTAQGGSFQLTVFETKYLKETLNYLKRHGWDAQYTPQEQSCFSMTTKSEGSYTTHTFSLKPLK